MYEYKSQHTINQSQNSKVFHLALLPYCISRLFSQEGGQLFLSCHPFAYEALGAARAPDHALCLWLAWRARRARRRRPQGESGTRRERARGGAGGCGARRTAHAAAASHDTAKMEKNLIVHTHQRV